MRSTSKLRISIESKDLIKFNMTMIDRLTMLRKCTKLTTRAGTEEHHPRFIISDRSSLSSSTILTFLIRRKWSHPFPEPLTPTNSRGHPVSQPYRCTPFSKKCRIAAAGKSHHLPKSLSAVKLKKMKMEIELIKEAHHPLITAVSPLSAKEPAHVHIIIISNNPLSNKTHSTT